MIVPPGGFNTVASKESVSGASNVIRLPLTAAMVRSVVMVEPAESQVCGWPVLLTNESIPMKLIQADVTGRRTKIVSPTLNPEALSTLKERVPEGTKLSVIAAELPTVCHDPEPERLKEV